MNRNINKMILNVSNINLKMKLKIKEHYKFLINSKPSPKFIETHRLSPFNALTIITPTNTSINSSIGFLLL